MFLRLGTTSSIVGITRDHLNAMKPSDFRIRKVGSQEQHQHVEENPHDRERKGK